MARPVYGAKDQYAQEEDNSPELNEKDIQYIRQATGKFLFYGQAIDCAILHTLNEIEIATNKGT